MLRADDILPDTYRGGRYLRRWEIVDGQPRCVQDALDTTVASAEDVEAVRDSNRAVEERIVAVEAFEAAQSLISRQPAPPPEAITTFGADGQPSSVPNPEHQAWQAARATVAEASDLTRAYAVIRAGRPAEPVVMTDPSAEWLLYRQAREAIASAG